MTGAGISTAAGSKPPFAGRGSRAKLTWTQVPDFRSPGTGLYANLARLNLPHAEAVFDISYFRSNPEPFYVLARELYPGKFHPTISHAFIALLAKKGLLDTLFTQNIDCLEQRAGVPQEKVVAAHGSFATQRCIDCKKEFDAEKMLEHVDRGAVPRCEDKGCQGLVKPDIVFFGEQLPKEFNDRAYRVTMADLVLVVGTSLSVYPFAALPEQAQQGKPRVLFNLERVGNMGSRPDDVLQLGDCDAGIRKLADALGWRQELEKFWEGVVGEAEANKQRATRQKHNEEIEDEVDKLTKEVDSALNFEEAAEASKGIQPSETETEAKAETEDPPKLIRKESTGDLKASAEEDVKAKAETSTGAGDAANTPNETPKLTRKGSKDDLQAAAQDDADKKPTAPPSGEKAAL